MIILRDLKLSDSDFIVEQLNDMDVIKFLTSRIATPYTKSDAKFWIEDLSKSGIVKVIEHEGQMTGVIGVDLGEFEYIYTGNLGYWLGKPFWGKGFASLAIA